MKKSSTLFSLFFFSMLGFSQHFITDVSYRQQTEKDFNARKKLIYNKNTGVSTAWIASLKLNEVEALKFLYAYMPLCDLADHSVDFYLKNIRYSLKARQYFSWGKSIPEGIFRHFVLPIRVNNEFLDSSRWVFFDELKNRIASLSLEQAILEVNHWCHEKVCYQGSDARTSSPLCTMKNTFGRCGEESVFTVAALRSVGIPARQCYTPRWAHCDDNHAWVEVWVNGNWHYIGACEPEATLDKAWFTAPAKRAMQVNTNVFGKYKGNEEVLLKGKYHTRINLIQQYAKTKKTIVKVVDKKLKPVEGAQVYFGLYNYAEFYPLATKITNKNGVSELTTGLGDMLVWVSYHGTFNFVKVSSNRSDTVFIFPFSSKDALAYKEFDLVPPPDIPLKDEVSDEKNKINAQRIHFEDSIRTAYMKTFPDSLAILSYADSLKMNFDTLQDFLAASRGNWKSILNFLQQAPKARFDDAIGLLEAISTKDFQDAEVSVLMDHLLNFQYNPKYSKEINYQYILNPRVSTEQLTAFRSYFLEYFGKEYLVEANKNIQIIIQGIDIHVLMDSLSNYYNIPVTPLGVLKLLSADKSSRNIFFVALCRSMGIPARLESATQKPQYYDGKDWIDVYSESKDVSVAAKGQLKVYSDSANALTPQYCSHYTISKLMNANLKTLDFEESPLVANFPYTLDLDTGTYVLITGTRLKDGSVLSALQQFVLQKDSLTNLNISMRKPLMGEKDLGSIDLTQKFNLEEKKSISLKELHWNSDVIMVWMLPNTEPTKHLFFEMQQNVKDLNLKEIPILLFAKTIEAADEIKASMKEYTLPATVFVGVDANNALFNSIQLKEADKKKVEPPMVTYVKKDGKLLFYSSGYQIGSVGKLLQLK